MAGLSRIESRWETKFSTHVQTVAGTHPASYIMDTGAFPGIKRPESVVNNPPTSSSENKEWVEICLYCPSLEFRGLFYGEFTFFFYIRTFNYTHT